MVDVLAVNPTDRDGALVAADLQVTYRPGSGDAIVVKVPHTDLPQPVPAGSDALLLPVRLPANGAVRGWLVFELDDGLMGDGRIEHYEVVVRDSRGISASIQPWALQEDLDEAPQG